MISGLQRWSQVYFNNTALYPNVAGIYLADKMDGLDSPPQRVSSSDAASQDGGYLNNALYSGRNVVFGGQVYSQTAAQYEAIRKFLGGLAAIQHDAIGKIQTARLELWTTGGSSYFVDGQPRLQMPWGKQSLSEWQIFLYCPDPIIYGHTENASSAVRVAVSTGFPVPFTVPFSLGSTSGGSASVINQGNAPVWPRIKLVGKFTNPRMTLVGSVSRSISLNYVSATTDSIIFDTNPLHRTVLKNGNTNMWPYLVDRNWFRLNAGSSSQISITSSDNSDTGTMQVLWNDGFITI